ncbi:MAG: hypothetical protein R6X02_02965 [Enhygromyxa sp.]
MYKPFSLLTFLGLSTVLASGCDRSNDADGAEPQSRSAELEPMVNSNRIFGGCTATAKCPNGAAMTCSIEGNGTCSGVDGVGVQCITYDKAGNPEESGGTCAGN